MSSRSQESPPVEAPASVDHAAWDALLQRHVNDGQVDYPGFQGDRESLDGYVSSLGEADPSSWPRRERLAFWINAYNACVIRGVLDTYPLKSVKKSKGFFNRTRYLVGGRELTLDEIESEGRALDPVRIHFAVVCAARSCPPLRSEAYRPEQMDAQLTGQIEAFLTDTANGLRLEGSTLWVSKIFDWYAGDFVAGAKRLSVEQLLPVLQPHLMSDVTQAIQQDAKTLKFLNYDWSLNEGGES